MSNIYNGKVEFVSSWDKAQERIKEVEKKTNENIVRLAKELQIPTGAFSEAALDLEYEVKDILDDGTILIDYNPVSDNMLKLLMLGSKLERHFMDLEERIENCWV